MPKLLIPLLAAFLCVYSVSAIFCGGTHDCYANVRIVPTNQVQTCSTTSGCEMSTACPAGTYSIQGIFGSGYGPLTMPRCASPIKSCTTDADCDQVIGGAGYCSSNHECRYIECIGGGVWDPAAKMCTCPYVPAYIQAVQTCSDQAAVATGKLSATGVHNLHVKCPALGVAAPTAACIGAAMDTPLSSPFNFFISGSLAGEYCDIDQAVYQYTCPSYKTSVVTCRDAARTQVDVSCGDAAFDIGHRMLGSSVNIGGCTLSTGPFAVNTLAPYNAMMPDFLTKTSGYSYEAHYHAKLCTKTSLLFQNKLRANCSVACNTLAASVSSVNWLPQTLGSSFVESPLPSDVTLTCSETDQLDALLNLNLHSTDCLTGGSSAVAPVNTYAYNANCNAEYTITQSWSITQTSCSSSGGSLSHTRVIHVDETEPKLGPTNVNVCVWPPRNKIVGIAGMNATLTALLDPSSECPNSPAHVIVPNGFCHDITAGIDDTKRGPCYVNAGVVYVLAAKSALGQARHYQVNAVIVSGCGNEYQMSFQVTVPASQDTDAVAACTSMTRDDVVDIIPQVPLVELSQEMWQEVRDNADATVQTFLYQFEMVGVDDALIQQYASTHSLANLRQLDSVTTDERLVSTENAVTIANIINTMKQNLKCSAPGAVLPTVAAAVLLAAVVLLAF